MSYDNAKIVLFSEIKNNIALKIKELDIFTRLKEGDKFGKYEEDNGSVVKETYFVTSPGYLQRAIRLYYGQDRYKSCKYLETDFKCFAKRQNSLHFWLPTDFLHCTT